VRIAFLCSSLAPGRDGVGDYVRMMCRALAAEGHECLAIALADPHVTTVRQEEGAAAIVRIPAARWHRDDTQDAAAALRNFNPDWVSLQMVSYGFEARGVLLKSPARLRLLEVTARRHLMFHETWIGEANASSFKERLVGRLQRTFLVRATRAWNPQVTHTSNRVYAELLRRQGIESAELALPGNIPVLQAHRNDAHASLLSLARNPGQQDVMIAGMFGSIHPEMSDTGWLDALDTVCRTSGRQLLVAHIGRAGAAGEKVWAHLEHLFRERVRFLALGERLPDEISELLSGLDIGIATSPWALIGKSGAVAALLDHGVPVVVPRNDYRLHKGPTPQPEPQPLLHRYESVDALAQFIAESRPQAASAAMPRIVRQFLMSLVSA